MGKKKDDDDLLAGLGDDAGEAVQKEEEDLLSDLEAGAPAWVPEEPGEGVQGVVTAYEEQPDDYNPDNPPVPVVTIKEKKSGDLLRIIGFSSVLRKEIRNKDPKPGDTIAVKYFGERVLEKGRYAGKPYKLYAVVVKKANNTTEETPF